MVGIGLKEARFSNLKIISLLGAVHKLCRLGRKGGSPKNDLRRWSKIADFLKSVYRLRFGKLAICNKTVTF